MTGRGAFVLRSLKTIARRLVKDVTLGWLFPRRYRRLAQRPVQAGKVVFFETKEREMPGSFDVLWERLSADSFKQVRYVTLAQNHVSRVQYIRNAAAALDELATAQVVFLDDASDLVSCLPLRAETKVVQLWHACGAFKKWGMSCADLKFGASRKDIRRHPFYGNLSLVTTSSPEVNWAYVEAMDLDGQEGVVQALGVSRTDIFFDEGFATSARKRIEVAFPAARGKKILLYAPTFRGHVSTATGPDGLDVPAMKKALGGEWVLLIKHHPFVKRPAPVPAGCEDFAWLVQGDVTIDDLLVSADACVSDYSSIVFEYSLFERPMAFFAYDLEDYGDWRGFYYSYDEFTPGPVLRTSEEVTDFVAHLDERFDLQQVRAFRQKFMSACDGHATERILDWLDGRLGRSMKAS